MGRHTSLTKEMMGGLLVEAMYTTDDLVAEKYGITVRSLYRYRRRLEAGDTELIDIVARKKAAFDAKWAEKMPLMLRKALRVIDRCFDAIEGDAETLKDPRTLFAVAGALKTATDVYYTGRVIDARLAESDRPPYKLLEQGAPETSELTN